MRAIMHVRTAGRVPDQVGAICYFAAVEGARMPTVARWQGYRFYFFSHEPNEPPHIHIDKGGATAKLWLQPVALARNVGFGPKDLRVLSEYVSENRSALMEAWHGHFGTKRG